ncbi:MAG: hypothetical protein LBV62_01150 [Rickettsiales bacterium]|jgi:hypothetical protein|nr:hypothetical protein [Rickettsiales bacterium]
MVKKTDLGSKILNYMPWRTALTAAALAIPVAGPIVGTIVGTLAYGNYRKNNRTENPASKFDNGPDKSNNKESKKESVQPGRLERLLSEAGTIAKRIGVVAIGFLLGGPIGAAIAIGLMVVDGISGGKLIQGAEKVLDVGYDALSWVKDKTLDAGKWAVDKMRSSEKGIEEKGKPAHSFDNPVYSSGIELKDDKKGVDSEKQLGGKVEAELRRRENSANQERDAARGG